MARYIGILQGIGGTAVRHGGKENGLLLVVTAGYDGSFIARVKANEQGESTVTIEMMGDEEKHVPTLQGETCGTAVYTGRMRDLTQCDQLVPYLNGVPLSYYPLGKNEGE